MTAIMPELISILTASGVAEVEHEAASIWSAVLKKQSGDPEQAARAMAQRRVAGTPLAYLTGLQTFMGIELLADEGALIPREETELLGNTAIAALRTMSTAPRVIDMCCGSGNLACAIANHLPHASVWASDLTDGCVRLTRRNVQHMGVSDRVKVGQGDLFAGLAEFGLEGTIDAVVCNPPYISRGKLETASATLLDHEPREAFDGGPYGLSIHQRVIRESLPFLRPKGLLLFEIGLGQDRQVAMLFRREDSYHDLRFIENSAGEERVCIARKRQ
jgi:release factor glutamine methyltransferase